MKPALLRVKNPPEAARIFVFRQCAGRLAIRVVKTLHQNRTLITSPDFMLRVIAFGPDSSFNAFLLRTNFPVFRIDKSPRLVALCCRTDVARVAATIYDRHMAGGSSKQTARGVPWRERQCQGVGYGVDEEQPQQCVQLKF